MPETYKEKINFGIRKNINRESNPTAHNEWIEANPGRCWVKCKRTTYKKQESLLQVLPQNDYLNDIVSEGVGKRYSE